MVLAENQFRAIIGTSLAVKAVISVKTGSEPALEPFGKGGQRYKVYSKGR